MGREVEKSRSFDCIWSFAQDDTRKDPDLASETWRDACFACELSPGIGGSRGGEHPSYTSNTRSSTPRTKTCSWARSVGHAANG